MRRIGGGGVEEEELAVGVSGIGVRVREKEELGYGHGRGSDPLGQVNGKGDLALPRIRVGKQHQNGRDAVGRRVLRAVVRRPP